LEHLFERFPELRWVYGTCFLGLCVRVLVAWFRARRLYPEVKYERGAAGADAWRWAPPPDGLQVADDAACSHLRLDGRFPPLHVATSILGYVMMAASVAGAVYLLATGADDLLRLSVPVAGFLAGRGLLEVNAHVVRVDLSPGEIVLVVRHGIGLHRRVRLRPRPGCRFEGRMQSALAASSSQIEPDAFLYYVDCRAGLLARRFTLLCNRTQGSWITGGLNAWLAARTERAAA
jgi:hypothetical protein